MNEKEKKEEFKKVFKEILSDVTDFIYKTDNLVEVLKEHIMGLYPENVDILKDYYVGPFRCAYNEFLNRLNYSEDPVELERVSRYVSSEIIKQALKEQSCKGENIHDLLYKLYVSKDNIKEICETNYTQIRKIFSNKNNNYCYNKKLFLRVYNDIEYELVHEMIFKLVKDNYCLNYLLKYKNSFKNAWYHYNQVVNKQEDDLLYYLYKELVKPPFFFNYNI